ncbi:MAG: HAMP domain-containing histidine kinase [Prevotellaceae bacterium]|jgi:signal transduction histidine kinase|nr:HAMP domain-containing histidine kinase [Prevotellaceae bacterium]
MNRAKIIVVKTVTSVTLSTVSTLCIINEYYFIATISVITVIILIYSISLDYRKSIRLMEQMIANIRCGDLNISFPSNLKKSGKNLSKSMNEALEIFRSRLYESIVSKAETEAWQKLIRVMTHEIMNSVAPIISLSETISEQADEDLNEERYRETMAAMQSIHRRSKWLLDFVENYRQLTRIPTPIMRYFSVNDLFKDIKNLFVKETVPVSFYIRPDDIRLYADRSLIEQVLINLLKNALDACRNTDAPLISVYAFFEKGKSVITVTDNGRGIVPDALDRIFVPFFTTKQGGSGIGLSLCRQIINRHNGTISVVSEPYVKTVFTIKFN